MNSPFVLLLPLAFILAYPLYAVLKGQKVARAEFNRLIAKGFDPLSTYDMGDVIVSIDRPRERLALVNIEVCVTPRSRNPPIDKDGYLARFTTIIPIVEINALDAHFSNSSIDLTVITKSPNQVNSENSLTFHVSLSDKRTVQRLIAEMPPMAPPHG